MKTSPGTFLGRGALWFGLLLLAFFVVTPLLWLVAASTKAPDAEIFAYYFFSPRPSLENFKALFTMPNFPFALFLLNSAFVTGTIVILQLFFSSLAGHALAKFDFKGKSLITLIMLMTLMIPNQVLMAPLYEQIYRLGLMDTQLGLIIPGAVSVFGIFLFRQAILQVPNEMLDAARIDGADEFRIYWDVVMPVVRPMVGAFCLIAFMGAWNSFLWPQIILHSTGNFTLPIGLNNLINPQTQQYGPLMAGTLLSVLPVIVLFLLLQKEFIAGLTSGAVKG
jgi:ABC-type glycerol-3-phosphate transport system permease component